MTAQQPTAPPLADRIAHAIDAIHHVAVRNPRDGGERMRRAKDVLIGIVSEVVASRESATAEIERQRARADKAEADLQCVTLTGDAVASDASLYKGNSVRHWWDKCQAYRGAFHDLDEARMEVERLKAELAKMTQQRDAYCKEMLDAKAQQQPEQCGAWGFCTLPVGHNMGRADIPENHQRPVAVPSDEEIAMAIKSVHMCGDTVTSSSLRLLARRIGVKL